MEQKAHKHNSYDLLFVAQPRQSLQFSGFTGRALEPVGGDRGDVSKNGFLFERESEAPTELSQAFEDETVDAYGEDEKLSGLFYFIAESMAFPWSERVLGDTVSVVGAEMPGSDRSGIDLVVEKNDKQSRIEAISVEMLLPYREGHLYLAAYLWKERA